MKGIALKTTTTPSAGPESHAGQQNALDVVDLVAGYGDLTVLSGVTLQVPQGAVVALLGPNGAGKTTLLRTVSGLLKPQRGEIALHGRTITHDRWQHRFKQGMCHIPEGRGIFKTLTVRENFNLMCGRAPTDSQLGMVFDAFPVLATKLTQRAGTLSGGQQQLLALSAAYLRNPTLILMDEATLGLSPLMIDEVFAFIKALTASSTSVLVVDQFVHRALEVADTAYVLRRGAIVASGPAADLDAEDLAAHYFGDGRQPDSCGEPSQACPS